MARSFLHAVLRCLAGIQSSNQLQAHKRTFADEGFFFFSSLMHDHRYAEMAPEEKHAISHRGRALAKLKEFLATNWPMQKQ